MKTDFSFLLTSKVALAAVFVMLSACSTVPDTIIQKPSPLQSRVSAPPAPAMNGAIFQTAAYRPMFEDRRARLIGDILTITISEKTNAAKSVANSNSKSGDSSYAATSLFAVPTTTTGKLALGTKSANTFDEKGAASSGNTFTGTIGVTVIDVLSNGYLVVSGEKQIALDKGAEYIRFSGTVNPDMIAPGNNISSTQVADARVEYRTNSRIDKVEMMSQLARFFLSILPL